MTLDDTTLLQSNRPGAARAGHGRMGIPMKWRMAIVAAMATLGFGVVADGCATAGPEISRVQTNLVDKSIFEGEWWYATTIIDVQGDEAATLDIAPFSGDMSAVDLGVDNGQSLQMARIKWVVDEHHLYAYRSYEEIAGGNDNGRSPAFRGQPLAAFPITDHVDVRRDYNPTTGEVTNVTVENTADRQWYERQFVRVDWSTNEVTAFYADDLGYYRIFNILRPEAAPFFFQTGAHSDFPASYQPQFVRVSEDATYRFANEWQASDGDPVHYMSFVTQQIWSPGASCFSFGGLCSSAQVTVRNSFLRVPPHHNYASETETHSEFDRFGLFRSYQRTYVRGGQPVENLHQHCEADTDCGSGGACNVATHFCYGGLTSDYGETDFLTFYRPRHNFFSDGLMDATHQCIGDWECSGVFDSTPGTPGAYCDRAAHRCAQPMAARHVRPVAYTLAPHYPAYLARAAFQVFGDWNEAFMRGWRAARGLTPPNGARVAAQSIDPGQYCWVSNDTRDGGPCSTAPGSTMTCPADMYCDIGHGGGMPGAPAPAGTTGHCFPNGHFSPEVGTDGMCPYKYDPFAAPDASLGTPGESGAAYDCHITGPADPAHPRAYADYATTGPDSVYGYQFVGSECMFVLKANSCDADPTKACQDLGDIRYQFFNYVSHGNVGFGGVSLPMMDPTNGELITSNANLAGESIESIGTTASHLFPVLRGEVTEDSWFGASELRGYFARAGRAELPPALAASGTDGYSVADPTRPGIPADIHSLVRASVDAAASRAASLHGAEGRSLIMSDRMRSLMGTAQESQLLGVIGQDMIDVDDQTSPVPTALRQATPAALAGQSGDALAADPATRAAITPFGDGLIGSINLERARANALSMRNLDPPFNPESPLYNSRYWQYWANQFSEAAIGGGTLAERNDEASIRMRQAYSRAVMYHEVGHSVGLRHNFGGTYDRNNYYDGYYNVAVELPLPDAQQYDDPAFGGDADGALNARELDKWQVDLRNVRNTRAQRGMGNVMSNSIMDYHGDLSDMEGLGRYDIATTIWNHFNQIEVYDRDPTADPISHGTTTLGGIVRADTTPRSLVQYYRGGDQCHADADCPFSADRFAPGADTPVTQRCMQNPRFSHVQRPCGGADRSCVCSAFDTDMQDYISAVAYIPQSGTGGPASCTGDADCGPHGFCNNPAHAAMGTCAAVDRSVKYMFCPDDRVDDISWCSRFDAGESFQEAVDHWRRGFEERYPGSTYFRHYLSFGRGGGAPGRGSRGSIIDAVKIYQHFIFRYFYEPGYSTSTGPLGIDDQYLASIDIMNWLVEIASLPDVGSYAFEADGEGGIYHQTAADPDMTGADFSLRPGNGYHMWSAYQTGLNGFFRRERAGVFYDKFFALYGLANRDWGLQRIQDERFFINFYDFWPIELSEVFGGYINDNPHVFAPRITTDASGPTVHPLNIWRTSRNQCGVSTHEPCRGPLTSVYADLGHPVDHTSTEVLRDWATILSLAQFPVFYDTSFEQRLSIYKLGNGDGHTIPLTHPDGTLTCTYGAGGTSQACPALATDPRSPAVLTACDTDQDCDPPAAVALAAGLSSQYVCDRTVHVAGNPTRGACTTPDSIQYTRDDTSQTYVAVTLHPLIDRPALRDEQLGFSLLREIFDSQVRIRALETACGPTMPFTCSTAEHNELVSRRAKLVGDNSYLEYLIGIQRAYGVSTNL